MHPQSPEKKIELQLYQQKSLESMLIAAADSSGTGIQSAEQSTKIIIRMRYCNHYYCAHSHALQVNPRVKKLILHNQRQLKQLTLVHTNVICSSVTTNILSCTI